MSAIQAADGRTNAAPPAAVPRISIGRVVYWSIRRELWEHRLTWGAPIVVALLMLAAFAFAASRFIHVVVDGAPDGAQMPSAMFIGPLALSAIPIVITVVLAAMFYCLEALYDERRDRSILFWKSLPVSDTATVLSKMAVPLVVLPILGCVVFIVMQGVVAAIGGALLASKGIDVAFLQGMGTLVGAWIELVGWFIALSLWYAPLYAWFLLVSGAVPRSPFLCAVLAPLVLSGLERIAFGTRFVSDLIRYRLFHGAEQGMGHDIHGVGVPTAFFGEPDLWTGLVVAALLLALTIWLRRRRQPI